MGKRNPKILEDIPFKATIRKTERGAVPIEGYTAKREVNAPI